MVGIIDQVNGSLQGGIELSGYYGITGAGQAFTGNGAKVTEAKFYLSHAGHLGEAVRAVIYTHNGTWGSNGTPSGQPLATSNFVDIETFADFNDTEWTWISFNFTGSNQFQTIAGQKYFIVLDFGGFTPSHYTFVYVGTTGMTSAFNGGTSAWFDLTWGGDWFEFGGGVMFQLVGDQPVATYNVTYASNGATGGSVPVDGNAYARGSLVVVASNSGGLSRAGYVLVGWAYGAASAVPDYALNGGAVFNISAYSVVLYAIWHQFQPCTVTYDANGGGGGVVDGDSPYQKGSVVGVMDEYSLYRPGWGFGYWYMSSDGGYSHDQIFLPGENLSSINF